MFQKQGRSQTFRTDEASDARAKDLKMQDSRGVWAHAPLENFKIYPLSNATFSTFS